MNTEFARWWAGAPHSPDPAQYEAERYAAELAWNAARAASADKVAQAGRRYTCKIRAGLCAALAHLIRTDESA